MREVVLMDIEERKLEKVVDEAWLWVLMRCYAEEGRMG